MIKIMMKIIWVNIRLKTEIKRMQKNACSIILGSLVYIYIKKKNWCNGYLNLHRVMIWWLRNWSSNWPFFVGFLFCFGFGVFVYVFVFCWFICFESWIGIIVYIQSCSRDNNVRHLALYACFSFTLPLQ